MATTFLLGGARSGKSRRAQELAERASSKRLYIATAEALDEEMTHRIARHQADRGEGWRTIEAALDLIPALEAAGDEAVVIDCLTLWLSNLMHHGRTLESEVGRLCDALSSARTPVFAVSNELGLGLVPETPLGREFRDAQGRLNQRVAEVCEVVEFVAAGLPLRLKG